MKCLFVCVSIFFLLHPVVGFAAPRKATTTTLTYDVYAGGLHALDATLTLHTTPTSYDTSLTAQTQGVLKSMANWAGKFTTRGLFTKGVPSPLTHQSSSIWKGETESKTFTYNGKGKFLSYKVTEGGKDTTPKDIDTSLAIGSTDTLSATLQTMVGLTKKEVCTGNSLIFDGDRSFRLKFDGTEADTLPRTKYNAYAGKATSCTVEVVPEKGKWRKKPRGWLSIQEQGRQKGSLPTIWFAAIAGQPDYYVPVKIRIKTDYGTLFMHLTSAKTE